MVDHAIRVEEKPVILVADDDEMQRFLIGEALLAEGFQVELVTNGAAALERAEVLRPDVVLLDVVMPGMDGFAACAALRNLAIGDGLPIVMVTGQDDLDSIAQAYDAGATDFIAKPINWTLLRHRIRYVYRAGRIFKQLKLSEARLAEAQRIAQLGSWEWTVGDDQVNCSSEVLRIFGLTDQPCDLPLARLLEPVHPDERKDVVEALFKLDAPTALLTKEFRLLSTDAEDRIIAVHARLDGELIDGRRTIKGTFQDVTAQRQAEARLYHLAHYDSLTGLPNRSLFRDRLGQALQHARREGLDAAALCVDIYRFKDINDSFGHQCGDRLLQEIAARLQKEVRGVDTVARLSGDEFAIAQTGLLQPEWAERLSHRLLSALGKPFDVDGQEVFLEGCVGIAIGPHDASDPAELMTKADMALHRAKADGPGVCCFFEGGMDVALKARKTIENDLRRALSEDWFELHYQPQIDIQREIVIGVEALLRLRHPDKGLMMPDKFIAIAEEMGLIVPIGSWVLRTACEQAVAWQRQGLAPVRVAVNLSPIQFQEPHLSEVIIKALADSGLDPALLEVEITENILIRDTATVIDVLHKLKALGVQIAMDDFGTGYSSLGYLQRFPFDRIKIDRSFINDMGENAGSAAIVGAVIALSKRLNMATTAEGIETIEQLRLLRSEGCDEAQGYYFSRPLPAAELIDRIGKNLAIRPAAAHAAVGTPPG
ncbi:MAG: EAL domain-containing protein [Rhizobiales bacterium]|nr:EAL domain-containing protein [Hyphomicrobiales bacterium]